LLNMISDWLISRANAVRPMLTRSFVALVALCGLAQALQASDVAAPLYPSLALDPPPPPSSPWSGAPAGGEMSVDSTVRGFADTTDVSTGYDVSHLKPYGGAGAVGSLPANDLAKLTGSAKAVGSRGTGLNYTLDNNLHVSLHIAGGTVVGGVIRH